MDVGSWNSLCHVIPEQVVRTWRLCPRDLDLASFASRCVPRLNSISHNFTVQSFSCSTGYLRRERFQKQSIKILEVSFSFQEVQRSRKP